MTGVVRSNRCGTCRKRKVKCDEAKPICGPCRVGGRTCLPPVSKVRFAKPKGLPPCHQLRPVCRSERTVPNNQVVLSMSPPLSTTDTLQLILLETFSGTHVGYNLSIIAAFIQQIPPRLGYSVCLDAAVACLVHRRLFLVSGDSSDFPKEQDRLYMNAISSLDAAINDPVEGYSDNTLCAVSILGEVELLGGGFTTGDRNNYIMHAGGAARLIQHRGPERHQSQFAKVLLAYRRGAVIAESITRGDDCFLDSPAWAEISFADLALTQAEYVCQDIVGVLVQIPSLLKSIRQVGAMATLTGSMDILKQAQSLRRALHNVGSYVDDVMKTSTDVLEIPATHASALHPTVYTFTSRHVANTCVLYWGFSIVLDTIIARYLPIAFKASTTQALYYRCTQARRQIIMSFEYALGFWPLGSVYMAGPLIICFGGANEDEKTWIVKAMKKLGEHISHAELAWRREVLEVLTKLFVGEMEGFMNIHEAAGYGTK